MAWPQPGHNQAPPNYRRSDINPMTPILADLGSLSEFEGPPTVNLVSGNPDYGTINGDLTETFSYDFTSEEDWLLGVAVQYSGDNGAFTLTQVGGIETDTPLVDGAFILLTTIPGSNSGSTLDLAILAVGANEGDPKTGTLTFYDRYTSSPFTPSREVATLTLTKTYVP